MLLPKSANTFLVKNCTKLIFINTRNLYVNVNYAAQVSFKLSDIGEGIREVTVKEWLVKVGDKVSQFDEICEVQSDKASVTITSRFDGVIKKLHYNVDETAFVGKPLVDIEVEGAEEEKSTTTQTNEPNEPETSEPIVSKTDILCIPSVRRLAKEHKVNLAEITGTGKSGRILKEDVLKYLQRTVPTQEQVVPIQGFQKAMVKTMTEALKIPHFVYCDEVILNKLSQLRQTLKNQEIKISYMPFFIKAASNALQRFPTINTTIDSNCENITYKSEHNIGIAMDTKAGLAVPVIKNVEKLGIIEINNELNRLIASGRSGVFSPNDLSGATFTISNIGAIGGTYMKPVIMPPQVAIIALGTSQILPRFDDANNVTPVEVLNLSASADHRIVDGATMARFVQQLKKQIQNPYLLFLNL